MYNPFSIEGKTFLVTGAASGMGKATAITCAKMGATVVAVDLNEEGLKTTLSELEGAGHQMNIANLADSESWNNLLEDTPELNGFAGCAGIAAMQPFQFIDADKMKQVFEINFFGPVMLVKALMKKQTVKILLMYSILVIEIMWVTILLQNSLLTRGFLRSM